MNVNASATASDYMARKRERLREGVAAAEKLWQATPVVWGRSDCLMSCADILNEYCFGFDPADDFRNRYTTPRGYLRMLKRAGFDSVDDAIADFARRFGLRTIKPAEAQVGDLGIIPQPFGRSCVMCRGGGFWIGRGGDYRVAVRMNAQVERAWAVI